MVMSKRAQIFLLAAVIVSAIVISLGITANQARVNPEPKNFYDFSYEIKREIGAVIDYEIYTNFSEEDDLEEFVGILAENIQDGDPNANFMFIYGSKKGMTVSNYGSRSSRSKEDTGTVSIGNFRRSISNIGASLGTVSFLSEKDLAKVEEVAIEIENSEFSFPIKKHRQVIFLMQKDIGDESFVTIE